MCSQLAVSFEKDHLAAHHSDTVDENRAGSGRSCLQSSGCARTAPLFRPPRRFPDNRFRWSRALYRVVAGGSYLG